MAVVCRKVKQFANDCLIVFEELLFEGQKAVRF